MSGSPHQMHIAMVGTRGVPAKYGGFETAVEEIGRRLADRGHRISVYCRPQADDLPDEYLGMHRVTLPAMRRRTLETLSHTGASVIHMARNAKPDVAIVFNAANSPWLPSIRAMRVPVATHVDGLEWRRAKWGAIGKRYYRLAEEHAVRWSDALIADAAGIADYYHQEFGARTELLSYGAPHIAPGSDRLAELGLTHAGYHLVVARFEPENHVHLIVDGFTRSNASFPLVVVGSAPYADTYTHHVKSLGDERVQFLGGVWDQQLLDQLYAGALTYVHGHSVGGTNPSLLRAIGAHAPVLAYDVAFNRDVLAHAGRYFSQPDALAQLIEQAEADTDGGTVWRTFSGERAAEYDWDIVTDGYEDMCCRLAAEGPQRLRPSGRRRKPGWSDHATHPQPLPQWQVGSTAPVSVPALDDAAELVAEPAASGAVTTEVTSTS